ncbi:MAG: hypothetical protein K9J13_10165 [Saprospiraceae bacterium]|nr:hypothetical protein [Saprospiraceae bacterium]
MNKIGKIEIIYLLVFFVFLSCKKVVINPEVVELKNSNIYGFYEFENGDQWFCCQHSYENGEGTVYAVLKRNGQLSTFNNYNNHINYPSGFYWMNSDRYLYISGYELYDISVNNEVTNEYLIGISKVMEFLYFDKKKKESVFFKENGNYVSLIRYNGITVTESATQIPSNYTYFKQDKAVDTLGGIWVGGDKLRYYYNSVVKQYKLCSNKTINNLVVDEDNTVWGLEYGSLRKLENDTLRVINELNSSIPSLNFNKLRIDNNNMLWLISPEGIYRYDIINDKFENIIDGFDTYNSNFLIGGTYKGGYIIKDGQVYEIIDNKLINICI